MKDNTYNGWKNRKTWNVALWINNDYGLYCMKKDFMSQYKGKAPYRDFAEMLKGCGIRQTNDGISYTDHELSKSELNSMMKDE